MKTSLFLQLAAFSTALVIPDEQVIAAVPIEDNRETSIFDRLPSKADLVSEVKNTFAEISDEIVDTYDRVAQKSKNVLDQAFEIATDAAEDASDKVYESYFDAQSWISSALNEDARDLDPFVIFEKKPDHDHDGPPPHDRPPHDGPPHHGPPRDGPPHHDKPPHDGPPHHGPPHDGPPHHGPPHHGGPPPGRGPHHKSNLTVYQLISQSNYTTILTKMLNEYPDLVEALNGTEANFTVFAPTDRAFERIPEHHKKPSKEVIKAVLSYHVSPHFYPAGRILNSRTIPTLLRAADLGVEPLPQRLSTSIGFKGLTLNFYSRVVAVDIFGSNGVIHGIDHLVLPPPKTLKIIDLLPSEFSTLELALVKSDLLSTLNSTHHAGGTFFAPSNFAFQKLGPRINAFLFSKYGQKYLKAILEYHVVANQTLYSDAYYKPDTKADNLGCMHHKDHKGGDHRRGPGGPGGPHRGPTKGLFHVDLPTLLDDRSLSIDIARYGRLIEIKINGFARVAVSDGVAEDGVIHVVSDVLIPPKKLANGELSMWDSSNELTEEELIERLEPFVKEDTHDSDL